jgi:hypothetical protein
MSFPGFVKQLGELQRNQLQEVMDSAVKLQKMTCQELWNQSTKGRGKTGFNYEFIEEDPELGKIHSIRITRICRARVVRELEWMRFISLHPDHDSAYK